MSIGDKGSRTFGLEDEPRPIGPSRGMGDDGFVVPGEQRRSRRMESFGKFSRRKLGEFFSTPFPRRKSAREKLAGSKGKKTDVKQAKEKVSSSKDETQEQIWSKRGLAKKSDIEKRFKDPKLWYKTRMKPKERLDYAKSVFGKTARANYLKEKTLKDERKELRKRMTYGKHLEKKEARQYKRLLDEVFGKEKKR